MKQCPQCGAEYDNHVERCFVDGTELSHLSTSAAIPAIPQPALQSRSRAVPLVMMGVLFVVATPLVVVSLAWLVGIGGTPVEAARIAAPDPLSADELAIVEPLEPEPRLVEVGSIPEGAEVWEEQTRLCAPTPCMIEQPDHAPAIRELVLRMPGYIATTVQLAKAEDRLQVQMQTTRPSSARSIAPIPSTEPSTAPSEAPEGNAPDLIQER